MSVVYTQPFRVAANGQKTYIPLSASPLAQNNAGNPGQDDDDTDSSHIDTNGQAVTESTTHSFHGNEPTSQVTEPVSDLVSASAKSVIPMASVFTLKRATATASTKHFTAKTVKESSPVYDEPSSPLPATYSSDVVASTKSVVGSLETDHTLTPSVWQWQLGGSTAVTLSLDQLAPSDPILGTNSDEITDSLVNYYASIDAKPSSLYCTNEDGIGMNCKGMKQITFLFYLVCI